MPYKESEFNRIYPSQLENFVNNLKDIFIYSVIWSIGCTTDYDGRVKFSAFLLCIFHENKSKFIPNGSVYYYNYYNHKGIFMHELKILKTYKLTKVYNILKLLFLYQIHIVI